MLSQEILTKTLLSAQDPIYSGKREEPEPVKRTALALALILALLFSAVASVQLANVATANPMAILPYITIKSDGSVEPQTGFIKQDGNVYTLIGDLVRNYAIKIQCSNIVFDGAGHVINSSVSPGYGYSNKGLSVEGVTNVTVKDVEVRGFWISDVSIESTTRSVFLRVKASSYYVENSDFNTIAESNIGYEYHHLRMFFANNNTLVRNNINTIMELGVGNSNIFFENNFWKQQNFSAYEGNFWDNGSIGNYWSWYKGVDANGDGIGDTPYIINSKDQDSFPLMNPWDPVIPYDTVPPRISISSPGNEVYNGTNVPLILSIYEPASSMSYSLDGQDNVTVAGNATLSGLPNGFHNLTVYVTDGSGNTGVSEVVYFNVDAPEPFPTTLVAASSIASVAVVGVGLLVYFRKRRRQALAA